MQIAVVYSSMTGNTALLAQVIAETVTNGECVFLGTAERALTLPQSIEEAEVIFVGFWTDKGSCDAQTASFLESLHGKQIFLFGTAGFGGDGSYFAQIMARVQKHIADTNQIVGSWMCQGKMPLSVRKKYETMPEQKDGQRAVLLKNFDQAAQHPDAAHLAALQQMVNQVIAN